MIYWIDVTDGNIFTLINRGKFCKSKSYIPSATLVHIY